MTNQNSEDEEDSKVDQSSSSNNSKIIHKSIKTSKNKKKVKKIKDEDKVIDISQRARLRWKKAFKKILNIKYEPGEFINHVSIDKERVKRYCYNSIDGCWVDESICIVKMENEAFGHGSMRECFRLKKMASILRDHKSWLHASNYVAKRYIKPVDESVYFDDVKLQMDAKLWGQEYSRQNGVVKKVDICKMSVIRFIDREGQPLYHLEHFIEGQYTKYNSNSGYVDDDKRNTPQAFSHFTFEKSGHSVMVVDIQGVGDIYTDPQIHTVTKTNYGDGNLGTLGMALFFYSHVCNAICRDLGLTEFQISESEVKRRSCAVKFKCVGTMANRRKLNLTDSSNDATVKGDENHQNKSKTRKVVSQSSDYITDSSENRFKRYFEKFSQDVQDSQIDGQYVIGEIHHELAKLYSSGRIMIDSKASMSPGSIDKTPNSNIDWCALIFHEQEAANYEYPEAVVNMAHFYLGLSVDDPMFDKCPVKMNSEEKGLELMRLAGDKGDSKCILFLGNYYYYSCKKIDGAHNNDNKLNEMALYWLNKTLDIRSDQPVNNSTPDEYVLLGRIADLMVCCNGTHSDLITAREHYFKAADLAMRSRHGKEASMYYEKAEQLSDI